MADSGRSGGSGGAGRTGGSGMPWRQARDVGDVGEELASQYLLEHGHHILDRNWRCARGELDIVSWDPTGRQVVFCEVKTRRSTRFGSPIEAVTTAKARRLRHLAMLWMEAHAESVRGGVRIDVIAVLLSPGSRPPSIQHLQAVA